MAKVKRRGMTTTDDRGSDDVQGRVYDPATSSGGVFV